MRLTQHVFLLLIGFLLPLIPVCHATPLPATTLEDDARAYSHWAAYLSQYDAPSSLPLLEFVEHSFFVENACYGRECKVLGWYNDTGTIYIDNMFIDQKSLFARSLIVHEMVHYLQDLSGNFTRSCADVAQREREAYFVQQQFYNAYGKFGQIRPHHYHCDNAATAFTDD